MKTISTSSDSAVIELSLDELGYVIGAIHSLIEGEYAFDDDQWRDEMLPPREDLSTFVDEFVSIVQKIKPEI